MTTTGKSGREPQIGFMKLTVPDLDASRTFYQAAFGMSAAEPIVQQGLTEQVLKSPDNPFAVTLLQYHDRRTIDFGNGVTAFYVGFYVEDMDASVTRAEKAGAKLLRGPFWFGDAVSYAFLESPDGHVIELIYRGEDG